MTILRDYKIIEDIKVFESEIPENHPDFDASTLDEMVIKTSVLEICILKV